MTPLGWAFNKGTPLEDDTTELLTLFYEELTTPGAEGAAELHGWEVFKEMYHQLGNDEKSYTDRGLGSESYVHKNFVNRRFDRLVHTFDPSDQRWVNDKKFEEAIQYLLPTASTWKEEAWLDEKFILMELDKEFGTTLQSKPHLLSCLVDLVNAARQGDGFRYGVGWLPEFPYELARRIWPVDTLGRIAEAYKTIIREARENERRAKKRKSGKCELYEFCCADVKASGIHQLIRELIGHDAMDNRAIRRQFFDIEVCQ